MTRFLSKDRFLEGVDLNRVLLAEAFDAFPASAIPPLADSGKFSLLRSLKQFPYTLRHYAFLLISVLWERHTFSILREGNCGIWFVTAHRVRPSYAEEIDGTTTGSSIPSVVTWKKRITPRGPIRLVRRCLHFIRLVRLCSSPNNRFRDAVKMARTAIAAIDLARDFPRVPAPRAVFSMKDFQSLENAIIQFANKANIPTFTSQHSVHHFFTGKNFRDGNLVFLNCEAQNVLCWGSFNQKHYTQFNPDKNCILSRAHLRPKIRRGTQLTSEADSRQIVIALGGRRHELENLDLLLLLNRAAEELEDISVIVRLHPTIDARKYHDLIHQMRFTHRVSVESPGGPFSHEYPSSAICLTGLTGTYYDLLYLGLRTIYFDYGYDLLEPLPTVLPKITSAAGLLEQIHLCRDISEAEWRQKANEVLAATLNLGMQERRPIGIIDEIQQLLDTPGAIPSKSVTTGVPSTHIRYDDEESIAAK